MHEMEVDRGSLGNGSAQPFAWEEHPSRVVDPFSVQFGGLSIANPQSHPPSEEFK